MIRWPPGLLRMQANHNNLQWDTIEHQNVIITDEHVKTNNCHNEKTTINAILVEELVLLHASIQLEIQKINYIQIDFFK